MPVPPPSPAPPPSLSHSPGLSLARPGVDNRFPGLQSTFLHRPGGQQGRASNPHFTHEIWLRAMTGGRPSRWGKPEMKARLSDSIQILPHSLPRSGWGSSLEEHLDPPVLLPAPGAAAHPGAYCTLRWLCLRPQAPAKLGLPLPPLPMGSAAR